MKWKVNDEKFSSFRHHIWNTKVPLKNKASRLFFLSTMQNGNITDAWNEELEDWDIKSKRPLNDRENYEWST